MPSPSSAYSSSLRRASRRPRRVARLHGGERHVVQRLRQLGPIPEPLVQLHRLAVRRDHGRDVQLPIADSAACGQDGRSGGGVVVGSQRSSRRSSTWRPSASCPRICQYRQSGHGDVRREDGIGVHGPLQHGPQVVVVLAAAGEALGLFLGQQHRRSHGDDVRQPPGVPAPHLVGTSAPLQHLCGEFPDHLQRPVAVGVVDRGHEQAVLDQRVEGVEDVRARQQVRRCALQGFQGGAAREEQPVPPRVPAAVRPAGRSSTAGCPAGLAGAPACPEDPREGVPADLRGAGRSAPGSETAPAPRSVRRPTAGRPRRTPTGPDAARPRPAARSRNGRRAPDRGTAGRRHAGAGPAAARRVAGTSSGRTGYSCSSRRCRGAREVASTVTPVSASTSAPISATPASICSMLSRISSIRRPESCSDSRRNPTSPEVGPDRQGERPGHLVGNECWSCTAASGTNATPSGKCADSSAAVRTASGSCPLRPVRRERDQPVLLDQPRQVGHLPATPDEARLRERQVVAGRLQAAQRAESGTAVRRSRAGTAVRGSPGP